MRTLAQEAEPFPGGGKGLAVRGGDFTYVKPTGPIIQFDDEEEEAALEQREEEQAGSGEDGKQAAKEAKQAAKEEKQREKEEKKRAKAAKKAAKAAGDTNGSADADVGAQGPDAPGAEAMGTPFAGADAGNGKPEAPSVEDAAMFALHDVNVSVARELGVPALIHQPSYSLLNRWIEEELLNTLGEEGIGCIAFSPLAQGLLTTKYLNGVPDDSRASRNDSLSRDQITGQTLAHVRALNEIARERSQSLAQMAISWTLRDDRVTAALIGASSVGQLEENLAAAGQTSFTAAELAAIDRHAVEAGINIWAASSQS